MGRAFKNKRRWIDSAKTMGKIARFTTAMA